MISVVINCDTRPGCDAEVSTTGDSGTGSLQGARSYDFLTDGVRNKLNFFSGHRIELILYVDEHEPLPDNIRSEIHAMQDSGALSKFVIASDVDRSRPRWNETLYFQALKGATGNYVAHFDGDTAAFRDPNSDIIVRYIGWLESGYKFVCQPTTMNLAEHGMWWASTRFFICKREMLNLPELEKCIEDEAYRTATYGHCPALEHVLGRMAGEQGVLYPPADWNDYLIVSWSRYHRRLLKKLNAMPYEAVRDYILGCGIHGPNDVISVPLP